MSDTTKVELCNTHNEPELREMAAEKVAAADDFLVITLRRDKDGELEDYEVLTSLGLIELREVIAECERTSRHIRPGMSN